LDATKSSGKRRYIDDAFHISWRNIPAFLHSPVSLILCTLRKFQRDSTLPAILFVPDWISQSWSPLLSELSKIKILLGFLANILTPGLGLGMKKHSWHLSPGNYTAHLIKNSNKSIIPFVPSSTSTNKYMNFSLSMPENSFYSYSSYDNMNTSNTNSNIQFTLPSTFQAYIPTFSTVSWNSPNNFTSIPSFYSYKFFKDLNFTCTPFLPRPKT
jgi:hypothetical protein